MTIGQPNQTRSLPLALAQHIAEMSNLILNIPIIQSNYRVTSVQYDMYRKCTVCTVCHNRLLQTLHSWLDRVLCNVQVRCTHHTTVLCDTLAQWYIFSVRFCSYGHRAELIRGSVTVHSLPISDRNYF